MGSLYNSSYLQHVYFKDATEMLRCHVQNLVGNLGLGLRHVYELWGKVNGSALWGKGKTLVKTIYPKCSQVRWKEK